VTIKEQQQAIREAAEHELCETLGYWYGIKRVDIENAVGLLFGKLTEQGAVFKVDTLPDAPPSRVSKAHDDARPDVPFAEGALAQRRLMRQEGFTATAPLIAKSEKEAD